MLLVTLITILVSIVWYKAVWVWYDEDPVGTLTVTVIVAIIMMFLWLSALMG